MRRGQRLLLLGGAPCEREGLRLREQSTHFHPLRGAEYHALPRVAPEDAELMDYDGTACEGAPGERRGLLSVRPC